MASAARSSPAAHAPQASVHPQRLEREQRKSAGCERRPAAEPLRSLTILGRHRRHFLAEGREITHSGVTIGKQGRHNRKGAATAAGSAGREWMGWPIRRVLSSPAVAGRGVAAIHLRTPLPTPPAAYPDTRASSPRTCPVWPCSGWGLPSLPGHPGSWWSLTPPFHPYLRLVRAPERGRSVLCGTGLRVTPSGRYPPPCSAEPGRSSSHLRGARPPGQPIRPSVYRRQAPALSPVISTGADSPAAFRRQDPRCQRPCH